MKFDPEIEAWRKEFFHLACRMISLGSLLPFRRGDIELELSTLDDADVQMILAEMRKTDAAMTAFLTRKN
jgi:hypothetical protein